MCCYNGDMSNELQLPARIVKEGEIVRTTKTKDLTITFDVDLALWEKLKIDIDRAYALPHQIGAFERRHLDDGAIDVSKHRRSRR